MSLTIKVLVGVFLGILLGLFINLSGLNSQDGWINTYIVDGLFFVIGKMFVNGLKMLVVPLVFFSLICGVCGIGNLSTLGRVGGKSFLLYMMTTAIAIAVAISLAVSVGLGEGMKFEEATDFTAKKTPPLSEVIAEIANEIMMKMVTIVMAIAPYAVFALIAKSVAELGLELLIQLAAYVAVLVSALLIHLLFTLMIVLKLFSGLSPMIFLRKIKSAQVFAFSTASSNATIPVTLRTVTKRLGVDNAVASFTVPFGATINMDGTAIMQGVATVFIANIYGLELGMMGYLTVILMSVLASVGTAGVPGVGLIMLSMVFTQVGLPVEGIGLILGVDRLMDMIRTAVNVSGDAVVSSIVAKSEGSLDRGVYDDSMAGVEDAESLVIKNV